MAHEIRRVDYFYATVEDEPGEACTVLTELAEIGIDLLAFSGMPTGPRRTQLTLFPDDPGKLQREARRVGLGLDGPHLALLVQGDDELGALARVHSRLADADVNVYASTGVATGRGGFGYVIYVRPDQFGRALEVLGM